MSYKNKIYVAFHYGEKGNVKDGEKSFYHTFEMWRDHHNIDFAFYDAHDINNIKQTSNDETIARNLRERLDNTKLMILLIGDETKYRRWVRWEVEQAIKRNIPIIAIETNNTLNNFDFNRLPDELLPYHFGICFFRLNSIKTAIDDWYYRHSSISNGYHWKYT